jgi:uncharacterized protein YyaL (SSP411 family)
MKRILLCLALTGLVSGAVGGEADGPVDWRPYAAALQEAGEVGKPVMIHFTADWCGWCKKMKKETYTHPAVASLLNEAFVATMVDADRNPRLKARYGVQGLPTIWFLNSEGEGITYVPGFLDAATFAQVLRWVATGAYRTQSYEEFTAVEG